ncbi:hypothetical protein [Cohaesibacter celericrescens]|uniref:Uncharacterized protein n=1 Tax=Cohaesibacter celericrescens TaxID=2067669 RepID=A0A2N5XXG9_9HYPH|nr:hypothetical protein [Cohaesibacter celericrescens]PLW79180.1 hypothetical protein C0081_02855 [Cohaesibacter celericrescens]
MLTFVGRNGLLLQKKQPQAFLYQGLYSFREAEFLDPVVVMLHAAPMAANGEWLTHSSTASHGSFGP